MDFTVSANQRVKIKESEKRDKYLDLAREMTVIPIVIGALGTIPKALVNELENLEL